MYGEFLVQIFYWISFVIQSPNIVVRCLGGTVNHMFDILVSYFTMMDGDKSSNCFEHQYMMFYPICSSVLTHNAPSYVTHFCRS